MPNPTNLARSLRQAAQLSQEEVAQKARVSVWTVSRFERGDPATQTVGTAHAIATALGTTLDGLFGLT